MSAALAIAWLLLVPAGSAPRPHDERPLGEAIERWARESGTPLRIHWSLDEHRRVTTTAPDILGRMRELDLDWVSEPDVPGWAILPADPTAAHADAPDLRLRAFRWLRAGPDGPTTVVDLVEEPLLAGTKATWAVTELAVDGEPRAFEISGARVLVPGVAAGSVELHIEGEVTGARRRGSDTQPFACRLEVPEGGPAPLPHHLVTRPPEAEQASIREEHGERFRLLRTEHFDIVSDTTLRYHEVTSAMFEQFYREVHPRFFRRPMPRVTCFFIEGGEDFEVFAEARGHAGFKTSYGFYVRGDDGPELYARRFFPDGRRSGVGTLFHEIVHAMVDADLGRVPLWFNEGFASLFERGRLVKGRWRYGNPNPWREAKYEKALEADEVPTLADYLAMTDRDFRLGRYRRTNYNTGRSFFLFLLRRDDREVARFVELVSTGRSGSRSPRRSRGSPPRSFRRSGWPASAGSTWPVPPSTRVTSRRWRPSARPTATTACSSSGSRAPTSTPAAIRPARRPSMRLSPARPTPFRRRPGTSGRGGCAGRRSATR